MTCLSINATSICNKYYELLDVISDENPDIIAICETWLNANSIFIGVPGYQTFRQDRLNAIHGGVMLLMKSNLNVVLVSGNSQNNCEYIFVDILFGCSTVRCGVVYRPPKTNLEDSKDLFELIYRSLSASPQYMLFGDYNLGDIDWETYVARSAISNYFVDVCHRLGSEQMVHFATHGRNTLDLCIVSHINIVVTVSRGVPLSATHHCTLNCKFYFNFDVSNHTDSVKSNYNFGKANYELINSFLQTIDWNTSLTGHSVSDMFSAFEEILWYAIQNFVPTFTGRTNRSPWFNNHLSKLKRLKNRRWKQYCRNPNIVTWYDFKTTVNTFKTSLLSAKCRYESKLFYEKNTNSKQFYAYVKRNTSVNTDLPCLRRELTGDIVVSNKDRALMFSEYFASVFTVDDGVIPDFVGPPPISVLESFSCDQTAIVKAISKMSSNSSSDPDGFNSLFLKNVKACIARPLYLIFSKSLSTGTIPESWKIAHVTPIYKKGDNQLTSNYRPVSLTSVFCKVLEHLVRDQLLTHLYVNNVIPDSQHGFVPKRSRVTNLVNCLDDWSKSFDLGFNTDVIYLDYAKCFDSVSHPKFLYKLSKLGITRNAFKWIENFLLNRTQNVKVGDTLSDVKQVCSGVPQGTVLGPIFYICYSADICQVVKNCKLSIYADDTKIYKEIKDISDCQSLQDDLDRIYEWAIKWQLTLHPGKSMLLRIGSKNYNFNYLINSVPITVSRNVTDLGVTIQHDLKFSVQCNLVIKKAYYSLKGIFSTFEGHDRNFYVHMYCTYVRPILESACQVWSPQLITDINKLERVQKYFSRRLLGSHYDYETRLILLNLESLEIRRLKQDLYLYFTIPHELCNVPQVAVNNLRSGSSRNFIVPLCRTVTRQNFWNTRIINVYNSLSEQCKLSLTLTQFKLHLNDCSDVLRQFCRGSF